MRLVLKNNKFIKEKDATISIFSDLMRGYGLFETLRTFGDKEILHSKEHINRLFDSSKKIDLKINYTAKEVEEMLHQITKKSIHKIQRVKIIAIPENIFITSEPLKIDKKIYKKGVKCKSVICERKLPELKSISYLPSFLSNKKATAKGYFSAILTNDKGEVYEGDYYNIFWFEKNILCTRKEGILKGIIREEVLKNSPFKIKFKKIKINELKEKKEIFLTNSLKGIVPITNIDRKRIGEGSPGKNTKTMFKIFQRFFYASSV